jgi:hypothetical protein
MSTKKLKANGAPLAPESPVINESVDANPAKKNGKSKQKETNNFGPAEVDGFIDGRDLLKVLVEVETGTSQPACQVTALVSPEKYTTLSTTYSS